MRQPWSCHKLLSKSTAASWWRAELCDPHATQNTATICRASPPTAAFCSGAALDELKLSLGGRASTRLCTSAEFGLVPTGSSEPAPFPATPAFTPACRLSMNTDFQLCLPWKQITKITAAPVSRRSAEGCVLMSSGGR